MLQFAETAQGCREAGPAAALPAVALLSERRWDCSHVPVIALDMVLRARTIAQRQMVVNRSVGLEAGRL